MITITDKIHIPDHEITLTFSRSAGPGGQNVNKVNSKVSLSWSPENSSALPLEVIARFLQKYASKITMDGRIVIISMSSRDQGANILLCKEKLAKMLQSVLVPPKPRRPTKPTKGSKERRLKSKKQQSQTKENRRKISY